MIKKESLQENQTNNNLSKINIENCKKCKNPELCCDSPYYKNKTSEINTTEDLGGN